MHALEPILELQPGQRSHPRHGHIRLTRLARGADGCPHSVALLKAHKNLKKAAGKSVRRPKPRKAKIITRAEARRRAERHVINRMFKGATVRDGMEACHHIYNVRRENTWVVYKNGPPVIKSSSVVVICKRTGRVLFEGSANDEG